ncbi:MAG: cation:proton antiporter [Bacteroidales bacterium]|nr:cation:proton antiporter [Bacteroidales bacterium]
MHIGLFSDIIIIFGLSILVVFIFLRIRVPAIMGFLLTGILAGPHGLQLIQGIEEVETLAEIGVVLLLFTIGIEFSIKNLFRSSRSVIIGGGLQVGLVIGLSFVLVYFLGMKPAEALFAGFMASLSSTAVVMKIIQQRGEMGTFHGRTALAILIFQDIIIVPMILVTPILAGESGNIALSVVWLFAKLAVIILITFAGSRYLMPWILLQIARTQNRELFLITIVVIGFAAAWLTASLGLSLALGAFVAGLIISESEYSEQAFGNIIPFRDVFTSFFFVSIGMLLDLRFVAGHLLLVLGIAAGVLIVKTFVSGFVAFVLGYPFRTTVLVGLSLSQIGEFSFLLADIGRQYELIPGDVYQLFLSSAVITLSVTPFIIDVAPRLASLILRLRIPETVRCGLQYMPEPDVVSMKDHLIIVGYGINGRNVAQAAKFAGIPHVIIELNPDTVKAELARGEIIYYGDATQEQILKHAGIAQARILVITIPHPSDSRQITYLARTLNPDLHILVRTRYIQDMKVLLKLGANEVIPEEFETSVEIFSRVLSRFLVPHDEIGKLISRIRADGYEMFRSLSLNSQDAAINQLQAYGMTIHTLRVSPGSEANGRSIHDLGLDDENLRLIALIRNDEIITRPTREFILKGHDILYVLGDDGQFREITGRFSDGMTS